MRKLMISTVFTALVAFSLPAAAQSIVLGPSSGFQSQNCDVVSTVGGDIDVDCFRPGTGTASFGSASGPYTIGTMNGMFGPTNSAGVLPADGTVTQSFSYGPDSTGNQTVGTITWMVLDYQGDFTGVYDPTVVAGTAAFTATFQDGKNAAATLTYSGGYLPGVLLQFPSKSGETSIQKGDIQGTLGQCKTVTTTVCN
jgi:hypothetical protein